uniref:Amino acid transporter transmembrane domain-containing protein n=1 Tax=Noctiluca scintillans TaxID=2966 RepID=A0A7S0ZVW5_NOCSC|mmetsp:Transcript_2037/g.5867  ORF Transcript_2037/g.5867 Transcript_2037/m.5867 type:complete len:482 (+) Transcript_2037:82-1527(+)|eukprot:CAMPEP_0194493476 /NCGR_PEP_ID=MMETSP0253-20130528/11676_1 /TAXON_ID=2966 /ORGANISM="Noctiluca scintillans" /LENGTH=481 /DNA_ID=CAMNT_0039334467 /DNA_START=67 /DNA_END=1512 /DNA_ORIENTATION=-
MGGKQSSFRNPDFTWQPSPLDTTFQLQTEYRMQASPMSPKPLGPRQHYLASPMSPRSVMSGHTPFLNDVDEAYKLPESGKTTPWQTAMNATLLLCGAGVLSIPYAIGQGGVLMGAFLLLLAGVCCWTAVLIGNLMQTAQVCVGEYAVPRESVDWPFLGYLAFGEAGRGLCSFVFVCELWFLMLSYLVTNGINLNIVFPHIFSRTGGIVFSGVLSFLLLFPSPKILSYASATGVISSVVAVVSLAWSAAAMKEWEIEESGMIWIAPSSVAEAIGILQFCFVAHSAFPTVWRNMEDTKYFSGSMCQAFAFTGMFYFIVGLGAYVVYGSVAEPSFMENLGRDLSMKPLPGLNFLYLVASFCFALNLQFSFPLFAAGLVVTTEAWVGLSNGSVFFRTCWKVLLMTVATLLAVLMRNCMQSIVSLTGSFCATFTCLLMPLVFSWKINHMSLIARMIAAVGVVYGTYILFYGTYTNVVNIVGSVLSG